jgi:hypothetical protein
MSGIALYANAISSRFTRLENSGKYFNRINPDLMRGRTQNTAGRSILCINVPNIEKAVADLRARRVKIVTELFKLDAISRKLAFFADPSGNLIELAQIITQAVIKRGR